MKTKAIMATLAVATLLICLVPIAESDADASYTEQVVNLPSGADIGTTVQSTGSGINLTINLEPNGVYSLTTSGNRNYDGHNITINGNGATVTLAGESKIELSYGAAIAPSTDYSNLIGAEAQITNVNFTTDHDEITRFSLGYYQEILITECTFEKVLLSLQSYSPGFEGFTNSTYKVEDCSFITDSGAYSEQFALTMQCVNASVSGCIVDGYDQGVNFMCSQYEGEGSANISNSTIRNISDGSAVQVSWNLDTAKISGCILQNCEIGIRVHNTSDDDGSVQSSDNEFIGCTYDVQYRSNDDGDISSASVSSTRDLFTTSDGRQKTPVISADETATSSPVDVIVEDPVKVPPTTPPFIFDDDEEWDGSISTSTQEKSDDTVTIVACAAAAVVAALMAAFLILDRKGN